MMDTNPNLLLVDVREESEYCDDEYIPGALLYPWFAGVLQDRYDELPADRAILVVCRSGGRSGMASDFLCARGFTTVYNMTGGMLAWQGETVGCCYSDQECDDGLFCTGFESCVDLNCQQGYGDPCAEEPYYRCDELQAICVECPDDYDCDGVVDIVDNCLQSPNGPALGTCGKTTLSDDYLIMEYSCMSDLDCEPAEFCMMNQEDGDENGIGDVCECEADFTCDMDVDGTDVLQFKGDYGRNVYGDPCTPSDPCNGDFNCDQDVDGSDLLKLIEDFGRNAYSNPCSGCSLTNCD